ncbi:MAG: ATPase [Alteromonadaceae bacterium]|nr:ATPase [Alteromonadaceae bacterium]
MRSVEELDLLIRASYPAIFVVSYEEGRVEQALSEILEQRNQDPNYESVAKLHVWSVTEGCRCGDTVLPELDSPMDILDYIQDYKTAGIFLLRDFANFLNTGPEYLIQRKLRDTINHLGPLVNIVIVDSELDIPARLEKLIAVVDFELPGIGELNSSAKSVIADCVSTESLDDNIISNMAESGSKAALGLTLAEAENVFAKSLAHTSCLDPQIIIEEKKHIIRKSGVLQFYDVDRDMDSVGGLGNLKKWLTQRGGSFSDEAKAYGLPNPRGVLIVGIPGTGKSLVSKCIGHDWNMPVLRMDVGSLFGSLVGQSEANMRKALKTAEALAPCVLWIDELEKSLGGPGGASDGGTTARVFGSFLSWMQEKTSPVFVVATANDVSVLPPEMLRKGRFDELFFVDLPNEEDRKDIINIHLDRYGRDSLSSDGLESLIGSTDGFSGAELEQVIIDAMYKAFPEGREPEPTDYTLSAKSTVPLSATMGAKIAGLRDWANGRAILANDSTSRKKARKSKKPRTRKIMN